MGVCMACGGQVEPSGAGVNRAHDKDNPGESRMGHHVRESHNDSGHRAEARDVAHKTLREMDRGPRPNLKGLAEGGETDDSVMKALQPDFSDPAIEKAVENAPDKPQIDVQGGLLNPENPHAADQRADLLKLLQPGGVGKAMGATQDPAFSEQNSWGRAPAPAAPMAPAAPTDQTPAPAEEDAQQPMPDAPQNMAEEPEQPSIGKTITRPQSAMESKAAMDQEYRKAKADYGNGGVTPQTYADLYAKKDTTGKIGTLFGLLLSGMGSGLAHQPNMLLAMMDKQIDRDLEAQKLTKGHQLTFLNAINQHHLAESDIALKGLQGKETQANTALIKANTDLTSANAAKMYMLLDQVGNMGSLVNRLPPGQQPQAMQAVQAMQQAVDQHVDQMNSQHAQQIEANWNQHNRALSALAPELSSYDSQRHVPGVGDATVPVDKSDRAVIEGHQKLGAGLNDLLSFVKTHSTVVPGTPAYNVGQAKVRKLQSEIREGVLGTVYREGEQPLLDKFITSNPAGLEKWWKTIPQLKTLQDSNNRDFNIKKKALGMPTEEAAQAPEYKIVNGVKYMRGPNGEAVRVK